MREITLKELLEAGCHFGHQTNRWHPKAGSYIYGARDGVHVIDLAKTREGLLKAGQFLKELAKSGGSVVFVGTKRQAKSVLEQEAEKVRGASEKSNFYYLLERWPGGFLTNFDVMKKNNLDAIVSLQSDISQNNFVTKKEKLMAQRKLDRYTKLYGGLVGLTSRPGAIFVVDVRRENGAVTEATRTGVKVAAIVDTNVNADGVDFGVPANDDAVGSVKIILDFLADAWIEGVSEREKEVAKESKIVKEEGK